MRLVLRLGGGLMLAARKVKLVLEILDGSFRLLFVSQFADIFMRAGQAVIEILEGSFEGAGIELCIEL